MSDHIVYPVLYKIDEKDKVRVWHLEQDQDRYCTHSGIQDGKIVVSKWKQAKPKNIGKKNEVDAVTQAGLEIERLYVEQKKTGGYYETIELAREGLKTYFQPMLAEKYKDRKNKINFPVWEQPKLDGCRSISNPGELKSREGEPFVTPTKIIGLMQAFHEQHPSYVFDGELYNHEFKADFEKIVSLIRKQKPTEADIVETNALIEYHIYDMFDRHRPDLLFSERTKILKELLEGCDPAIVYVPTSLCENEEELDTRYGEEIEDGYEGQMVRIDEVYEMKRSKFLLKRKEFEDAEFVVKSVEEGVGNWAGAIKRVEIFLGNGDTQWSGVSGKYELLAEYLKEADRFPGTEVTVRFQGRTNTGRLRFPVVKVFWRGKRNNV